jgi:hypothetical protein
LKLDIFLLPALDLLGAAPLEDAAIARRVHRNAIRLNAFGCLA